MDESLIELEKELKTLRPRRPSPHVARRIELDLHTDVGPAPIRAASAEQERVMTWRWFSRPLAAAAAIAVLATAGYLGLKRPPTLAPVAPDFGPVAPTPVQVASSAPAPAARDTYRPVRASNVLYDLKDEGTVYLPDRSTARQMRYRYVDTYTWTNPKKNASLKWSMPRDEVRVLPASMN